MLELIVDKQQSLKEFTDTHYAQASFVFRALLKEREIRVNGKKTGEDVILYIGDCVQYYLTKKQAEKSAYKILYEDTDILIVDKQSGVNSEAVYEGLRREVGENTRFIHRLDRNTAGLLVFAMNADSEEKLLLAFKEHTVEKVYHAVCVGNFPKQRDILTAYLEKDERKSRVFIHDTAVAKSEKIITEYRVLERVELDITRVEITLHTGKTHQIRAHLAHVGCHIVGDMKYGIFDKNKEKKVSRQCLVAKFLRFHFEGKLSYLNNRTFESRFFAELS